MDKNRSHFLPVRYKITALMSRVDKYCFLTNFKLFVFKKRKFVNFYRFPLMTGLISSLTKHRLFCLVQVLSDSIFNHL